jgi:hypothetical protein
MAENPMLSLILYHFSADLKTTVAKEDQIDQIGKFMLGNAI